MTLSTAILAGGLATRIRPITERIPKAMIEVSGRPFIDYQLELLKRQGVADVVLCLGYEGRQIEDHVGDGKAFGLRVRYSYDGPTLLGTGGALRQALGLLGDPFFVTYGDAYLRADYRAIAAAFLTRRTGAEPPLALMTVFHNRNEGDRSNTIFRDGEIVLYDKTRVLPEMEHIDWGLGVLTHAAFDRAPSAGPFDLATLYTALVGDRRMMGYEVTERFYEIGSFAGIDTFKSVAARLTDQS